MNKYIDVHNHLLYGIDDGSQSENESLEILKKLKELGFTQIIATPHYIEGTSYNADNHKKTEIIKTLLDKNILNIYLGNEVYILNDLIENIENNKIYSLNGSKYVLIEFSFTSKPLDLEKYIFNLTNKNIIPIIAHPERYVYVQDNYEIVKEWIKYGALLQGNYESINGKYGKSAKNTFKKILGSGYYHFLGTDVHKENSSLFNNFPGIVKDIKKEIPEEYFETITYSNPKKVINNEDIDEVNTDFKTNKRIWFFK